MNEEKSFFTSLGMTFVMSLLAIVMLINYSSLVVDQVTPLRLFGLIAWIGMGIYFIKTFLQRLQEHRQLHSS